MSSIGNSIKNFETFICSDKYDKEAGHMRMKGFVTIATGDEKYYKLAFNLLRSYKLRAVGENILPFAIICDRKNKYTEYFDDIIILPETETTRSFMDKLFLYRYTPYEETLFVDADSYLQVYQKGCGMIFEMQMTYAAMEHRFPGFY